MTRYCVVYPLTSWYVIYVDAEDEEEAGEIASASDHGTIVDESHLPEFVIEPPDDAPGVYVVPDKEDA